MEKSLVKKYTVRQPASKVAVIFIAAEKQESIGKRKMSDRICKMCGGKVVQDGYYAGSIFYKCQSCNRILGKDMTKVLTVFEHITQSVETLAEKLVYHIYLTDCMQRKRSYWRSTFFPCNNFATKEKAIAATIEELKKEWNENEQR